MADEQPVKADPTPGVKAGERTTSPWPLAVMAVLIVSIIAGTYVIVTVLKLGQKVVEAPAKMVAGIQDAFRPRVTVNTVISTTLDRLKNESKLVVLTARVNVEITKESEKSVLWGKVDLGSTRVRLKAVGNKIQYYVPLEKIEREAFKYDDFHKRITVTVPAPKFDEQMVDVQSDPSMMEVQSQVGWGRLDSYSGGFLRDQARRDLRPAVVQEGKNEMYQEKARTNARVALKKLLEPLAGSLKDGIELEVEFK